jgi:hypothetical protein
VPVSPAPAFYPRQPYVPPSYRGPSSNTPRPSTPAPFSTLFRPGTVTAAGVILYIGAALALVVGCLLLLGGSGDTYTGSAKSVALVSAFVYAIAGVGNAVLAYFVMKGKRWAQVVTIALSAIGLLYGLVSFFAGGAANLSGCIAVMLNAVIIGLLLSSSAKAYFSGA